MTSTSPVPLIDNDLGQLFGQATEPIELIEQRASLLAVDAIVWEGNAATFEFTYVGPKAELMLGYPARRWITEPTFWADIIIDPADRDDAIAYCALATAKAANHVFEYRARAADGRVVWLRDFVRVVIGNRGIPIRLRGIMFDISAERRGATAVEQDSRNPSSAQLEALPGLE